MGYNPSEKPKQKYKKGLWSPDEDLKLKNHIMKYGHGCWTSIPVNAGLQRNGKSCRLRWINYLRPGLKRGAFTLQEEETILTLHRVLGNKWSQISHHLPGRTDNEIKNHWHSYLKKRVSKMAEEVDGKSKKFQGLKELSPSSSKLTPQNSSFESLENTKILFAEWLSLDRFNDQNQGCSRVAADSKFTFDYGTEISEDSSVQGHQLNEKVLGNEMHTKSNLISMNGVVQSPFGFADQISESGLVDYFPGEFDIYCDELYM